MREEKYKRALETGLLRAPGISKVLTFLTKIVASASGPDPQAAEASISLEK